MKLTRVVFCLFLLISISAMQAQDRPRALQNLERINSDNASRLERLRVFGRGTISTVDWSPDGTQIAVGGSAGIWIYEANDLGAEPIWLEQHRSYISSVAYHPDGESLFTAGNDSRLRVFDTATYNEIADYCFPAYVNEYSPDCAPITGIDVSQNGALLAIALNDHIVIWDVETRQTVYRLFDDNVYHVAFAVDDTMLVSTSKSWDNTVRFWDLSSLSKSELNQEPIALETNLPFGIWDMQVSDDSDLVIIAGFDVIDSGVAVIDIPTQDIIAVQSNIGDTASFVSNNVVAGSILSFNDGDTARYSVVLVNLTTGEREASIETGSTVAADIALSSDGNRIAIGTTSGDLIVYDMLLDVASSSDTGLGFYMWDTAFSADGQSLAVVSGNRIMAPTLAGGGAAGGGSVYLWELENDDYRLSIELTNQSHQLRVIQSVQDGEFAISGDQVYGILLWNIEDGFRTGIELPIDFSRVFDFELSADTQIGVMSLSGSATKAVGIIQMDTDNPDIAYYDADVNSEQFRQFFDVAIHPDGILFAATGGGQVYVWRTGTPEPLRLNERFGTVTDIAFSPSGEWFAMSEYNSAGLNNITLFDTGTFTTQLVLNSETLILEHMTFNRDSDLLVASTNRGDIVLWPVESDSTPIVLHAHSTNLMEIAVNLQGTLIATSGSDGTVQVWGIPAVD